MSRWADVIPPITAIAAMGWIELLYPEKQIGDQARMLGASPKTSEDDVHFSEIILKCVTHGWQTIVDLGYTFWAIVTLLLMQAVDAIENEPPSSSLTILLVALLVLNVTLICRCVKAGPEATSAVPSKLPFRIWFTLRQASILFVICANLLIVGGVALECLHRPKTPMESRLLSGQSSQRKVGEAVPSE